MTAIADADAAIDAELDKIELVSPATAGEVVDPAHTPCTRAEAQSLIARAVTAANDFYVAIAELLSRDGHVALGYDSPRQMMARELSGMLVNPRTGKPVSETHLRRMTRVAWLAWSIAQNTGIDMDKLHITERDVRSISAASAGDDDRDLIEDITARLAETAEESPDKVSEIISESLSTYEERKARGATGARGADTGGRSGMGTDGAGGYQRAGGDYLDDDDSDDYEPGARNSEQPATDSDTAREEDSGQSPAPAPSPAASVASIFDTALPEGVEAGLSDLDVNSALAHLRTAADVRRVMHDITAIHALMPEITKIAKQVPHIIDAIDDDELAALENELRSTDAAVEWAAQSRQVIVDALTEVDTRYREAI